MDEASFRSKVHNLLNSDAKNFMRVRSSFVADLVILSGDPKIVDVSNLFVNFEVV